MRYMSSNEIRNTWLKFFESKKHFIVESAPLVPKNDPTLLWINAGVAPLKKYFDGSETPKSKRMTNIQKCIRTNDIENVGLTARHHTFFEMLGNFSIGDYFKDEAIEFGFELLTDEKYFGFPLDKLYFTYYTEDITAKNKWLSLGVSESHLIPNDNNYWEIGEGPSGPNTEIFFDRGEKYDSRGIEILVNDLENDRYIEIWNIVFSQYNAKEGLERKDYPELPNKNIDTGAGLERFACILQDVKTNFETDLFYPIIKKIEEISNVKYDGQAAFKVIADHIKTLVFAIGDGAILSNEGRGYVLRRVLRRAVKYGRTINLTKPFLYLLVPSVIETMKDFYPNLVTTEQIVTKIILKEEEKFLETITEGEKHFFESLGNNNQISGADAFKLYDTYGFPIELTIEYANDNNSVVDVLAFKEELLKQKERSRNARVVNDGMNEQQEEYLNYFDKSLFVGYDTLSIETKVIKVFEEGIILEKTPFYATSGGQVADKGTINDIDVTDVIKLPNGQFLHKVDYHFEENQVVMAKVNEQTRFNTEKNHSATHLLHQALKDVLGTHVNQQGSLVNENYLRFDFNHFDTIENNQIIEIEKIVKAKIKESLDIVIKQMSMEDAKGLGAMALFGEKYGDIVRVVNMGYSIELCGGTHLTNTKDINDFAVLQIESIGSGTYRITASTDTNIKKELKVFMMHIDKEFNQINEKLSELNSTKKYYLDLSENSYQSVLNNKELLIEARSYLHLLEKELETTKKLSVLQNIDKFIGKNITKKEVIVTNDLDSDVLKELTDAIYDKIKAETILLINIANSEATIIAKTDGKTHAGNLVKDFTKLTNGRGGGRDTMAQGGTKDLSNIDNAIKAIKEKL